MKSNRPLAVVTGASSGIGLALAREAALRGYDLGRSRVKISRRAR